MPPGGPFPARGLAVIHAGSYVLIALVLADLCRKTRDAIRAVTRPATETPAEAWTVVFMDLAGITFIALYTGDVPLNPLTVVVGVMPVLAMAGSAALSRRWYRQPKDRDRSRDAREDHT